MDPQQTSALSLPLWPEDFAARYREKGYWRGEDLSAPLRRFARETPQACALIDSDGRRLSYAELEFEADRAAAALLTWGLMAGDRMILQLPNRLELVTLFFGCIRAGVVPVMVLPTHRAREVLHLAQGSGAVAYAIPDRIASFDFRDLARQVQAELPALDKILVVGDVGDLEGARDYETVISGAGETRAFDPINAETVALYLHSGGTSGLPKLIPRSHNDYAYNARVAAEVCGLSATTVYLACLAVEHNFPLACPGILGTLSLGGTVVLARDPSPAAVFGLIAEHRVTLTAAVPTLVALWLEAREFDDRDLSSLEMVQVGGARLAPVLAARIPVLLGARVQQVFGMAEGLLNLTRREDPTELVEISQGRPASPDDEVRIVNEAGQDVLEGEVGELWTRGPYTIRQYVASAEVNARAFTPDGFYRSGDLVRRLPSGHLVVEGRAGDQINRGGEKFSAAELEDHLIDHPALRDVAVIGLPDENLGQATCAVICPATPSEPPSLRALRSYLSGRGVATYKLPDRLEVVARIPLTRFGKIDRNALLAQLAVPQPA